MFRCYQQAPEWHEMYCFTLRQYQALCVAVSLSHARPVWKCCRTPRAPLLGCLGLTVHLTQTCDITVKDEYIYSEGGGGGGAKREKCPGQEMEEAVLSMSGKHF